MHVVCCCSVAKLCAEAFNWTQGQKSPLGPRNQFYALGQGDAPGSCAWKSARTLGDTNHYC